MEEWILRNGAWLRAVPFFGLLAGLALLEHARPWRTVRRNRGPRWRANLALLVAGALAARLVVPAGAVGAALWAEDRGVGLLTASGLPVWLRWTAGIIALDLALWLQHLALHRVPLLWSLHRVHHT
ncbi:MAG: sterol desaturase family protein, partial [Planctomycetota bacterium]